MKITKNDVLKTIQKVAKAHDFDLSLKEVDEILTILEESIVEVGNALEVGESANVACIKVAKKETKKRKGVSKLSDQEVEWEVPGKIKIVLSAKKSFEKENEKIVTE